MNRQIGTEPARAPTRHRTSDFGRHAAFELINGTDEVTEERQEVQIVDSSEHDNLRFSAVLPLDRLEMPLTPPVEAQERLLTHPLSPATDYACLADALAMLRRVRGAQENDFKAARSFALIDRLVDRGGARCGPDDRPVDNPAYREMSERRREVQSQLAELSRSEPISSKDKARLEGKQLVGRFEEAVLNHKLSGLSQKVPRVDLEPTAERAWLKTKNRALLQPLKYVLANGRRWLLSSGRGPRPERRRVPPLAAPNRPYSLSLSRLEAWGLSRPQRVGEPWVQRRVP